MPFHISLLAISTTLLSEAHADVGGPKQSAWEIILKLDDLKESLDTTSTFPKHHGVVPKIATQSSGALNAPEKALC